MLTITTKQLSQSSWENKGLVVDPTQINSTIQLLIEKKTDIITIYDRTYNNKFLENELIPINDHINHTGINPLIGKQKELNIDFIDMTHVYNKKPNGVITHCNGKELKQKHTFPSHYISLITIIARALQYKKIIGFLVNKKCI